MKYISSCKRLSHLSLVSVICDVFINLILLHRDIHIVIVKIITHIDVESREWVRGYANCFLMRSEDVIRRVSNGSDDVSQIPDHSETLRFAYSPLSEMS